MPVATLGPSGEFPAFYSRRTVDGLLAPMRLADPASAARLIAAQTRLFDARDRTGILLAVPIPESQALDPREIEESIERALEAAHRNNVRGKSVTPFLLGELSRLTAGRSLHSSTYFI